MNADSPLNGGGYTSSLPVAMDEELEERKITVYVEVCLKADSVCGPALIREALLRFLEGRTIWYKDGPLDLAECEDPLVRAHVAAASISDADPNLHRLHSPLLFWQYTPRIFVYQLSYEGPIDDDEGEEGLPSYRELLLPAVEISGQWEALQFDSAIKQRLLSYATSALLFSDARVDPNLVAWNRVVLLYGPPGTGKTSLCKSLAHKLCIRLGDRYRSAALVEVNAHSLFSKYFSESGKLVSRLFNKIGELVEEEESLVFVLIDEVESLTSARKAAVSGSEPSDAIRAVNALLTQLDQLRRHPNVMVLTTSNITEAIDVAFVDRADIKAYIGPPSLPARYEMLRASVQELGRAGILADDTRALLLPFTDVAGATDLSASSTGVHAHPAAAPCASNGVPSAERLGVQPGGLAGAACGCAPGPTQQHGMNGGGGGQGMEAAGRGLGSDPEQHCSQLLLRAAAACAGLSGRTLRKLPFLAHAGAAHLLAPCPLRHFLHAMHAAAVREQQDRSQLVQG